MKTLGTIGKLRVYADRNHDRDVPSWQVWVEVVENGRVSGTASGNCAAETGTVERDDGRDYRLSDRETKRLEEWLDQWEGKTLATN